MQVAWHSIYSKITFLVLILKFYFTVINFGPMNNLQFPGQTGFYRGKVRDVYTIKDKFLVMIASIVFLHSMLFYRAPYLIRDRY